MQIISIITPPSNNRPRPLHELDARAEWHQMFWGKIKKKNKMEVFVSWKIRHGLRRMLKV